MATTTAPPRKSELTALTDLLLCLQPGHSVLFSGVNWSDYVHLCEVRDEHHKGVKITYDRGRVELMSPSYRHEKWGSRLADLVKVYAEEAGIPHIGGGGTTFRREDLERGLEPDECFYVQNTPAILHRDELDLTRDPPPDLAIEIDVTRSSLSKASIYEELRVPELWRFDGSTLEVRLLSTDGRYELRDRSLAFPRLNLAELVATLRAHDREDDGALRRAYRTLVRRTLDSSSTSP